jgi:hypothetical protein
LVDTPYIRMPGPEGSLDFESLDSGRWKLRVAAPGAETLFVETIARTSPPSLEVELRARGGIAPRGEKSGFPEGDAGLLYPRY